MHAQKKSVNMMRSYEDPGCKSQNSQSNGFKRNVLVYNMLSDTGSWIRWTFGLIQLVF